MGRQTPQYLPDYAVSPGDLLVDELELHGMTPQELAGRTGLSLEYIVSVVEVRSVITPEAALKLHQTFGLSLEFWSGLDGYYQETLARLNGVAKTG